MKPNFFSKFFFNENVAQELAQLLAETWCPYLLWVLRNLPHKFEKLAHVTKSAKKKRHHMGNLAPLVPQKRHHMGISLRSCPKKLNANNKAPRFARRLKNIGATACRAWARAETFNGLQKVLENVYIPDTKT